MAHGGASGTRDVESSNPSLSKSNGDGSGFFAFVTNSPGQYDFRLEFHCGLPQLSPNKSPSESDHCVTSCGKSSSESAKPSLSASGHPALPLRHAVPAWNGHWSGWFAGAGLSPYPSPSISDHCEESVLNGSIKSLYPSPSLSSQYE